MSNGYAKQNFDIDQRVVIDHTSDPELDGKLGTVIGRSMYHVADTYIILLDHQHSSGNRAVTLIETLLYRSV